MWFHLLMASYAMRDVNAITMAQECIIFLVYVCLCTYLILLQLHLEWKELDCKSGLRSAQLGQ